MINKTAFYLLLLFLFSGCTVRTLIYIRNITDSEEKIYFISRDQAIKSYAFGYTTDQKYLMPDPDLPEELSSTLQATAINDSCYTLNIPPHSIILFDRTYNFDSGKFVSVKLKNNEFIEERFIWTGKRSGSKRQGVGFKSWYDIK